MLRGKNLVHSTRPVLCGIAFLFDTSGSARLNSASCREEATVPDCSQFQQQVDALRATLNNDLAECDSLPVRDRAPCKELVRDRLRRAEDVLRNCLESLKT